ncbi:MAG: NAD-dependent epimerase [SAR324 cluster bacterium]|uniref:NAD-dependent epimerase n=1 Tax=SAR324 cluster bacterium TaxID=2024889 RepID=A0A2A4T176_9DELT|nr:MAG: NAD-dependent epimerase [SAR324 cluster bacterium]
MNITVFGGAGFLGSHVCDKLSDAGHRVTIFDLKPSLWLRNDQTMLSGDILDEGLINMATREADVVFNFAGLADIAESNQRAVDTVKYNILGNTLILEACVRHKVKRFVYASSVYVYSGSGGFYRCSKQACEQYIENYRDVYGLEYTILRYGTLYGLRANEKNSIHRFVKEAMEKGTLHYTGSPKSLREYVHVEDAAQSSVEILEPQYANECIILAGHQSMRVEDVFRMIAEMLGKKIEFTFEETSSKEHYEITPYSFNPKVGKKLAPPLHTDMGQGVLKLIEEQYRQLHPELHSVNGVLLKK